MQRNKLLYIALGLSILLAGLHFIASAFYLYWTVSWYDSMMHFLGGIALACFLLSFAKKVTKRTLILSFLAVMTIAVGWEIFEYTNGLTASTEGYKLDTIHDLLFGGLGALTAGWTILQRRRSA